MANNEHPINGMMDVTMEKIRQMVDANTIIGNPINTADGTTILPVSKITYGFVSGGGDYASNKSSKDLFGGGSGAGVSVTPVAFLVLHQGNVRMIQIADKSSSIDRALNLIPDVMDKVQGFVDGSGKNKKVAAKDNATEAAAPEAAEITVEEIL